MNLTKSVIVDTISKNIQQIRKYGVLKIGLFGSYAKNTNRPESDIDFLVELSPSQTTYDNYFALIEFLESLFGIKVEVVTIDSLSLVYPRFFGHGLGSIFLFKQRRTKVA